MEGRGKQPSERTIARLRRLLEQKQRAETRTAEATDALARAARDACDKEGASRAQIAQALGVGTSTVQGWVQRGRQLDN